MKEKKEARVRSIHFFCAFCFVPFFSVPFPFILAFIKIKVKRNRKETLFIFYNGRAVVGIGGRERRERKGTKDSLIMKRNEEKCKHEVSLLSLSFPSFPLFFVFPSSLFYSRISFVIGTKKEGNKGKRGKTQDLGHTAAVN